MRRPARTYLILALTASLGGACAHLRPPQGGLPPDDTQPVNGIVNGPEIVEIGTRPTNREKFQLQLHPGPKSGEFSFVVVAGKNDFVAIGRESDPPWHFCRGADVYRLMESDPPYQRRGRLWVDGDQIAVIYVFNRQVALVEMECGKEEADTPPTTTTAMHWPNKPAL